MNRLHYNYNINSLDRIYLVDIQTSANTVRSYRIIIIEDQYRIIEDQYIIIEDQYIMIL
jgi:hypothetical protein